MKARIEILTTINCDNFNVNNHNFKEITRIIENECTLEDFSTLLTDDVIVSVKYYKDE